MTRWSKPAAIVGATLALGILPACAGSAGSDAGAHGPTEPPATPAPSTVDGKGGANGPDQPSLSPAPDTPSAAAGRIVAQTSPVYAFSEPSTAADVVQQFAGGEGVSIVCTARGEQVTASGSTSDLWDRISGGGYVPDVQVETGSNDPVMPDCSG